MSLLFKGAVWALNKLGGGVLDRVLGFFETQAKSENEALRIRATVTSEEIRAELDSRRAARDIVLAEQGWWVTAMIRPAFAWPIVIWSGAIVADSLFHFDWNVAALPEPLNEWAGWIVGAYFLTRPFEKAIRGANTRRAR
ncbi:3TM-type holin [Pseudovibrio sp. Tun.PSC04-5.I4]|uniref:3TM-type holin n=1 Tax=Pseudovibrio sp. Tun.PSC04-5.I4 TaxID=1798213 RepID=UPI00087F5A56|nr:3TM-type holin [Pseudovibrio sp. Tun.PSC04-5.I4]SDR15796.1 Holin of 3TMs, for gene-transfer release [Pseudovibrio sp. Tun.PSC04-5.I4]SDR40439.1 Holin of 3TMs, for gene-transfer release [Pseudovibrio sp. Tun.PSC04-5.I4]